MVANDSQGQNRTARSPSTTLHLPHGGLSEEKALGRLQQEVRQGCQPCKTTRSEAQTRKMLEKPLIYRPDAQAVLPAQAARKAKKMKPKLLGAYTKQAPGFTGGS